MTSHDTTDDAEPTTETESNHGRRRFVQLSGSAVAVGLAGCSDMLGSGNDETPEGTTGGDGNGTDEPTATATSTENGTDTDTENGTDTESDDEGTPTETEGDIHEHGTLYLEIDGDRHEFTDPKYSQASATTGGAAGDNFHFHDDGNPYYWHMHDVRLTLQEALESLPDIAYERRDGSHALEFEGETYVDGEGDTEVQIRERDVDIDPTEYQLQDGDIIWIEVFTDGNGS